MTFPPPSPLPALLRPGDAASGYGHVPLCTSRCNKHEHSRLEPCRHSLSRCGTHSTPSLIPLPLSFAAAHTSLLSNDRTQMDTCGTRTSPYSHQGAYSNMGRTWGAQADDGTLPGMSYSPAVLSSNVAQLAGRPASEGILQLATALTTDGIQSIAAHFAMGDVAVFTIDDAGELNLRWRVRGSQLASRRGLTSPRALLPSLSFCFFPLPLFTDGLPLFLCSSDGGVSPGR